MEEISQYNELSPSCIEATSELVRSRIDGRPLARLEPRLADNLFFKLLFVPDGVAPGVQEDLLFDRGTLG